MTRIESVPVIVSEGVRIKLSVEVGVGADVKDRESVGVLVVVPTSVTENVLRYLRVLVKVAVLV